MFTFSCFGYAKPFNIILKENSTNGNLLLGKKKNIKYYK